ncbi:MAG: glycoside hydrolase family protein [Paracoccaceae bacterium]|nr:MAG: glycoside hydrolase family protein [Paracoccaceae bacterium]
MRTSAEGVAFLERHEGVVLRAYRCPAGVWTIGAGLTAASGVVQPTAGMTIDAAEARRLLIQALTRNYEPAVDKAMTRPAGAKQHEFDAGVSFHFNTGAIGRATWVGHWRVYAWDQARAALAAWRKGGGKVLPGLVRRRAEEFALLREGDYGHGTPVRPDRPTTTAASARIAAPVTAAEVPAIREALQGLGYEVGLNPAQVRAGAVQQFQRDHGLTDDGIIGRATASVLQRVLDARAKSAPAAAGAAAGGAVAGGSGAVPDLDALTGGLPVGEAVAVAAVLRLIWLAWTYRDALAPAVQSFSPRLAALMRSF